MNIHDVLNTQAVSRISQQNVANMQSMLNSGQRAEVYLYYKQLMGGSTVKYYIQAFLP